MISGFYATLQNIGPKNWRGRVFHESQKDFVFQSFLQGFTKEKAKKEFFKQFQEFLKNRGDEQARRSA